MIAVIDYYEVAERVVDANKQHEQCKLCPKPTKQGFQGFKAQKRRLTK